MLRLARFFVMLLCALFAASAYAATCDSGYYLNDGVCTECEAGYYCVDDVKTACADGTYSVAPGASECATSEFIVTTTAGTSSFSFYISAAGTFEIDWGDGTIETIEKTNTTYTKYSHTYSTGGVYEIGISGQATGYTGGNATAAISFASNKNVAGISGSLGAVFGTLADGTQPRFFRTFSDCSSMTGSIPAELFSGISGAPASGMFQETFYGCSGLTGSIPEGLFSGISGAPAGYMFKYTFFRCSGLTGSIPEGLFSGISGAPAEHMFAYTFYNCSRLTGNIPDGLFSGISGAPADYMFYDTFYNCSGLTGEIPAGLFSGISGAPADYMFSSTFYKCSGLTGSIPAGLFSGISGAPASSMFSSTFSGCSGLTGSIPEGLFSGISGAPAGSMFSSTFSGCSGLTGSIPEGLFGGISGAPASSMFSSTFYNCSGLTGSIPAGLFGGISGAPASSMFSSTFYNCSGLTGSIPEGLFSGIEGVPASSMFYYTFSGCSGLTGSIPAGLFSGISGAAANSMFYYTFYGCSNLTGYVDGRTFNTTGSAANAYSSTFSGASKMDTVCPAGTYAVTKPDSAWTVAVCLPCPDTHPESDAGADSINMCYAHGQSCDAGYYYATTGQCTICPVGFYCAGGAGGNINYYGTVGGKAACPSGKYSSDVGATECATPDAGYYVTGAANGSGATAQTQCEAGYYCVNGVKTACADGTYSDAGAAECTTLDAGYYATGAANGSGATGQTQCEAGYYCTGGVRTACADGTYSNAGAAQCSPIEDGYYCSETVEVELTSRLPSVYTELEYIQSYNTQYIDTGVHFMVGDEFSITFAHLGNTDSENKMYGAGPDSARNVNGGRNPSGDGSYYQPWAFTSARSYSPKMSRVFGNVMTETLYLNQGTDRSYYIMQNNTTGASAESSHFTTSSTYDSGNNVFLFRDHYEGGHKIPAYAKLFSATHKRNGTLIRDMVPVKSSSGTIGMYDLVEGVFYTNAGTGTFTAGPEVTEEEDYFTNVCVAVTQCEAGYYCVDGVKTICPENTSSEAGATICISNIQDGYYLGPSGDEILCEAGYYCVGGVKTACANGTYSDEPGATACKTPDNGYYASGAENGSGATAQTQCEAGYYCANGVKTACADNAYSEAGAVACTLISNMDGGYYATESTDGVIVKTLCDAGYYCTGGVRTACADGTYSDTTGLTTCKTPDAGYYVTGAANGSGATAQTQCEAGYYCVDGVKTICPENTSSEAGATICISNIQDGYYLGPSGDEILCEAGYYCTGGVKTICPAGTTSEAGAARCSSEFTVTTTADTTSFSFQISASGTFTIDWGDGTIETIEKTNTTNTTYSHTYSTAGAYKVGISGQATGYASFYSAAAISFSENANVAGISGSLGAVFGTLADGTQPPFVSTFQDCNNLTGTIPAELFSGISGAPEQWMFLATFHNCNGLTGEIPADLFNGIKGAPKAGVFAGTFYGCSGLTGEIPAGLFSGISGAPAYQMFYYTFYNCSGLTGDVPAGLFSGISGASRNNMFDSTFKGCGNLTGYVDGGTFTVPAGSASSPYIDTFADATNMDTVCPAGTYAVTKPDSAWTVAVCSPCPETHPSSDVEATSIDMCYVQTSCDAGNYYDANTGQCATCPAGSYCLGGAIKTYYNGTAAGDAVATLCPDGMYSGIGATECTENCDAGNYFVDGVCTVCPDGTYNDTVNATECKTPDTGYYASGATDDSGATAQTQCEAGFYCADGVRTVCPAGTYSSSAGATSCKTVDVGHYGTDCGNFGDYTRLEYIEGTGKQYIDTGYYVQRDDEIGITGQITAERFGGYGNCFSTSGTYFLLTANGTHASTRFGNNVKDTFTLAAPIELYTDFTAVNNKTNLTIDGTVVHTYGNKGFYTPTEPTYLLHYTCASVVTRPGLIKRWWVMRDGELVRNMVPMRRNSDGAIGMFDTVEYRFYENAGTGEFVAGPVSLDGCASQTLCPLGAYCADGLRYACANAPQDSAYTTSGWATAECPWVCDDGFGENSLNTCSPVCAAGITKLNSSTGVVAPLFAVANTVPALHIKNANGTCHADLIAGTGQNAIHIRYNGQTYHTMNVNN